MAQLGRTRWRERLGPIFGVLEGLATVIVGIMVVLFYVCAVGGVALYVVSRVYLLIECIITIPHLPDAVFDTVVWSQYFPHMT